MERNLFWNYFVWSDTGGSYYNTAWSSAMNKFGQRVLTQQADLVTAHGMYAPSCIWTFNLDIYAQCSHLLYGKMVREKIKNKKFQVEEMSENLEMFCAILW